MIDCPALTLDAFQDWLVQHASMSKEALSATAKVLRPFTERREAPVERRGLPV